MKNENNTPTVYIACLASYNAGRLHGVHIPLDCDEDEMKSSIAKMLKDSRELDAEEWAVHDHENCGSRLSEYPDIDTLLGIGLAYKNAEEENSCWDLVVEYSDSLNEIPSPEVLTQFNESYAGSGEDLEDWCFDFLAEIGAFLEIPKQYRGYFDVEAYARDLELGGDINAIEFEDRTHVFWTR